MEKIYYNGCILTLDPGLYTKAVLTCNNKIMKIGDLDTLAKLAPNAQKIDLMHKTMLPAFIDAHSHFSSYANVQLQVSLENTTSFLQIANKINDFINTNNPKANEWIIANGYDHNILSEKRHPDLTFLDEIAPNNPLILQHQSGHCGMLNTKALTALGISFSTPSTSDGVIGRENGKLTGYMEEGAFISCIKKVPMASLDTMMNAYNKAQQKYLSYGITTIQEGMLVSQMLPLYEYLIKSEILVVDVVGYPDVNSMKAITKALPNSYKKYDKHFKIGGYKIILDGSPQLKTAWMKTPYLNTNDCGYGAMSDTEVFNAIEKSAEENVQILAHCNGDAATEQFVNAVEMVSHTNKNITDLKPVIIHSQLISKEQLPKVAKLSIIPSFFIAHVLHWGDTHIKNFGFERAEFISPAKSAVDNNIIFTFHQDTPVIEPNMLETLQCAVTRKTKNGVTLGESERISVLEALKAVTINAAYQYSEENSKGSIKEGKLADFVILSDNPLEVPTNKISEIKVLETIKNGETVFKLND